MYEDESYPQSFKKTFFGGCYDGQRVEGVAQWTGRQSQKYSEEVAPVPHDRPSTRIVVRRPSMVVFFLVINFALRVTTILC
jgi:hypothetical protein